MKRQLSFAALAAGLLTFSACEVQEQPLPDEAPQAALEVHEDPIVCPGTTYAIGDATEEVGTMLVAYDQYSANVVFRFALDPLSPYAISDIRFVGGPTYHYSVLRTIATEVQPVGTTPCATYQVEVDVAELDFFGDPVAFKTYFVKGSPGPTGGYVFTFCAEPCLTVDVTASSTCISHLPGYSTTAGCVTLTAAAAVAAGAPYTGTYLWSTGETTPSITVCPTATTTYSVQVSAYWAMTAMSEITVTYQEMAAPCGPGGSKIQICHYPPGGGGAGVTQCKPSSWVFNYLDTHGGVAALVPGASGITLGPCGAPIVPCGI